MTGNKKITIKKISDELKKYILEIQTIRKNWTNKKIEAIYSCLISREIFTLKNLKDNIDILIDEDKCKFTQKTIDIMTDVLKGYSFRSKMRKTMKWKRGDENDKKFTKMLIDNKLIQLSELENEIYKEDSKISEEYLTPISNILIKRVKKVKKVKEIDVDVDKIKQQIKDKSLKQKDYESLFKKFGMLSQKDYMKDMIIVYLEREIERICGNNKMKNTKQCIKA